MLTDSEAAHLASRIKGWALELGFNDCAISDIDLEVAGSQLQDWLALNYHGGMDYMHRHGSKRYQPDQLIPGTISIISARMNYLPKTQAQANETLAQSDIAYISRYALGRDYHKLIRKRLDKLATQISEEIGPFGYRVFTDSAPVLEKPIAAKSGLGWVGKHSNLINREHGSWFFLGEIYTDLPLATNTPIADHCGDCIACIQACPTNAIVAPYVVDARKCISYLTIEQHDVIPVEYRPAMGNRIYGCDDCQLVCPWNRFAPITAEVDFLPRHHLDHETLVVLFSWTEDEFLDRFQGSPIRRIGYQSWLRNIAVALGNADTSKEVVAALQTRKRNSSELLREHIVWSLARHQGLAIAPQ